MADATWEGDMSRSAPRLFALLAALLLVGGCAAATGSPLQPSNSGGNPDSPPQPPNSGGSQSSTAPSGGGPALPAPSVVRPEAAAPAAAVLPPLPGAPVAVQTGVLGILAESGIYIAAARGYFAEEGIAPEFTIIDTGARAIPLLATGQIQTSGGGFSPAYVNAAQRGIAIKMVAALGRNEPDGNSGWTVVRKDLTDSGQVRDWPDLRGRTVAVPGRGSVNDYSLERGLQLGGLSLADVELVEMPFPDMVAALANANIDAAYLTEPIATLAAERGIATKWQGTGMHLPGVTPAVLSYAPSFIDEQPEVGRRWMAAYLRGARDYTAAFRQGEGKADVVRILTENTTVKDPALYDRIGMSTIDPDGWINVANIADQAAWYADHGLMPAGFDVTTLVDTRFRDAALARLGPYRP
jgi:NitT/TauT family transport system substrate-binding protein